MICVHGCTLDGPLSWVSLYFVMFLYITSITSHQMMSNTYSFTLKASDIKQYTKEST